MHRRDDSRPRPLRSLRRAATGLGALLLAALAPAALAQSAPPPGASAPAPAAALAASQTPAKAPEGARPAPPAEHHEGRRGEEEEGFKNLKILPKDISRHELFNIMRFQFVRGLGVGCLYCHVGDENKPPSTYDFASDDKPTKRKARVMWKMTQAINQTYLAELPERLDPPVQVQCITCHRGQPEPRQIQDVLRIALDKGGPDAAVARYHELRDKNYGDGSYDFSESALTTLARSLAEDGRTADATAMLQLNMKQYPDFWLSYAMLGDMQGSTDKASAVENLKKALDLAPDESKRFLEHRLQQVQEGSAGGPQDHERH